MIQTTILFVDDDVLTQWVMTDILVESGYLVTSVCRGDEALRLVQNSAEFDLLLTDVDLPDSLTGTDIGQLWRELRPGRPTIYTGARRPLAARHLAPQEVFLSKPFGPADLLSAVEYALCQAQFAPVPNTAMRATSLVH